MAALITFRRTNLAGQERWKLLIPLGEGPVSARKGLSFPGAEIGGQVRLPVKLLVAQGQGHRAGRDSTIQVRLLENLSVGQRPMHDGVAGRALEAFPGFPHGIQQASRNRVYTKRLPRCQK
jgi:hypothetical protein